MWICDSRQEADCRTQISDGRRQCAAVCALSRLRLHEILLAAAQRAKVTVRTGVTVSHIDDGGQRHIREILRWPDRDVRSGRRLRRHPLGDARVFVWQRVRAAAIRLWRLARAGAPARKTCAAWNFLQGNRQQDRRHAARRQT